MVVIVGRQGKDVSKFLIGMTVGGGPDPFQCGLEVQGNLLSATGKKYRITR